MKHLLEQKVQDWIKLHTGEDVRQLALRKNPFPSIPYPELLNQVEARQKCKSKLPLWYDTPGIIYPPKLSIEQSSSQATASFKATLVNGNTLFDATGGFGVDDHFFAKQFKSVIHCERNAALSEVVSHNVKVLLAENIESICSDSTVFLTATGNNFDCIYVDPSRRHESKGKVFKLSDCEPNVPDLLELYFSKADSILIKSSPMLDISVGLQELTNVWGVHVVALAGEVKELLWLLKKGFSGQYRLFTVNLESAVPDTIEWKTAATPAPVTSVSNFLYEPDAAIRKAGAFDEVAHRFGVSKLHRHTHLYTSDELVTGFPGRTFKINASG
ncbi:MAG: class I SAM-dependent methyltransferase, partial [Chitinophagaceae bacterium]